MHSAPAIAAGLHIRFTNVLPFNDLFRDTCIGYFLSVLEYLVSLCELSEQSIAANMFLVPQLRSLLYIGSCHKDVELCF